MVETVERDHPRLLNRSDEVPSVVRLNPAPQDSTLQDSDRHEPAPGFECRRVKPLDLHQLARGLQVSHFDQPDSYANRNGVLGTAVASLRPFNRWRPITNVARGRDGSFQGFVQFRQELPDRRWVLQAMGSSDDCADEMRVRTDLLEFSIARAGSRGVKRLFAKVPSDSSDGEAVRAVGFEPYMSESVLRLGNVDIQRSGASCAIRMQEPADTWAVHQLYHASVPHHVQFAEAWTSHRWDVHSGLRSHPFWRSFVLEDGFQLVAWARVRRAGSVASLEFMFLPDHLAEMKPFVESVLKSARQEADVRQIFVTSRAYQEEFKTVLTDSGFQDLGTQELMVRYTTAKLLATATEFIPIPASEALERVPKRVPTYLNGSAREEPT